MSDEATALVPTNGAMIRPVESLDGIVAAWKEFQRVKERILDDQADYQGIGERRFIKKSGWRKIAAAFGVSTEIVYQERHEYEKHFAWHVTARATTPSGRYAEGMGSCASNERRFAHLDHDVRAMASTRAINRAIADLVGGGEVSADEMTSIPLICQEPGCGAHLRAITSGDKRIEADDFAQEGERRFGRMLCSAHFRDAHLAQQAQAETEALEDVAF